MHHQSSQPARKRRRDRRGDKARLVRAGQTQRTKTPGARRRRQKSDDLLTHVCEIMKLFPDEGDRALAELVGRIRVDGQAGAAVGKSRRAGNRSGR